MPITCCLPNCNSNSGKGPNVSVFHFPKDPARTRQWLEALKWYNFTPTKSSVVCELHFEEVCILRATRVYSEDIGELLEVPLLRPQFVCLGNKPESFLGGFETIGVDWERLNTNKFNSMFNAVPTAINRLKNSISVKIITNKIAKSDTEIAIFLLDAVPTIFPSCNPSLSKVEVKREAPATKRRKEKKRMRLEYNHLEEVVKESPAIEEQRQSPDRVTSFPEFNEKLNRLNLSGWLISKKADKTLFYFEEDEGVIKLCVSVCSNLNINLYYNGRRVRLKEKVVVNSLSQFETYLKDVSGVWREGHLHEDFEENLMSVKKIISTIKDLQSDKEYKAVCLLLVL